MDLKVDACEKLTDNCPECLSERFTAFPRNREGASFPAASPVETESASSCGDLSVLCHLPMTVTIRRTSTTSLQKLTLPPGCSFLFQFNSSPKKLNWELTLKLVLTSMKSQNLKSCYVTWNDLHSFILWRWVKNFKVRRERNFSMIQVFLLKELGVSWYPSPHPKTSLLFPFIRKLFIGSQKVLLDTALSSSSFLRQLKLKS